MKEKSIRNYLALLFILGVLASISFSTLETNSNISFAPSSSIYITSDTDFGPSGYNFPGAGSVGNPYRIENLEITTTNQSGIYITGTTSHFIIQNCTLTAEGYGIFVESVASGTVEIINNTCYGSINGISVWYASSTVIANNTCIDNESYNIYLDYSENSIVANNTSGGSKYGMLILYCRGSIIENNTYTNEGLDLFDSALIDLQSYSINNNYANGKLVGWFIDLNDIEMNISLYNQLYFINCTRCTVTGQLMQNSLRGITLFYCTNTTLYKNTLNHVGWEGFGIFVDKSENTTIEENTISNFDGGINIRSGTKNTNITNNIFSNCYSGISVGETAVVQYNTIRNGGHGIRASSHSNSDISHNTIEDNNYHGIYLWSVTFSKITHNMIRNNGFYGVYLYETSMNNIIHHNSFISNRDDPGSQAYDDGINNIWYEAATNEGNGWDDLGSETTYLIDGSAGAIDLYPTNLVHMPEFQQTIYLILILSSFGITIVTLRLRKHKN